MKLTEFYSFVEGRETYYTLEPETNGNGRLLCWEDVSYGSDESQEEEHSYEVVAHGGIDKLLQALKQHTELQPDQEEEIRAEFDRAIDDGETTVKFSPEGGVERMEKRGGESEADDVWTFDDLED